MMKTEIEIKKNCDNCIKKSACKFLHAYKELVKSNMFYEMFEYAEWNNLEYIFKNNASKCSHYRQSFQNGKLIESVVGHDIFYKGIQLYVGDNLRSVTSSDGGVKSIETKDNTFINPKVIEETFTVKIVNKLTTNETE